MAGRRRIRDAASVALGVAVLFALSWVPMGAVLAGLLAGAVEGNAAKGFFAALGAGVIYASVLTAEAAGAGPVALAFAFYEAYVVDTVLCAAGGILGGLAARSLRGKLRRW